MVRIPKSFITLTLSAVFHLFTAINPLFCRIFKKASNQISAFNLRFVTAIGTSQFMFLFIYGFQIKTKNNNVFFFKLFFHCHIHTMLSAVSHSHISLCQTMPLFSWGYVTRRALTHILNVIYLNIYNNKNTEKLNICDSKISYLVLINLIKYSVLFLIQKSFFFN